MGRAVTHRKRFSPLPLVFPYSVLLRSAGGKKRGRWRGWGERERKRAERRWSFFFCLDGAERETE